MAEESKLVQEQIKNLQDDIKEIKEENRDIRKRLGIVEMSTQTTAQTLLHMNDMMKRMETTMDAFTNSFSKKIDDSNKKIDESNKKMDDFINSDKRRDSKKNLIVSIVQIVAGMVGTIAALWASGKL